MKVKDLASELGQSVKPFIRFREVDIKVKTGNTRLDDDMVETIKKLFEGQKEDALVEEVEEGEKLTIKVNDSEPLTWDSLPISLTYTKIISAILKSWY